MDRVPALPLLTGTPPRPGSYVAYVDDDAVRLPGLRKRILLTWSDDRWGYPCSDQNFRGIVHGFVGPLPPLVNRS